MNKYHCLNYIINHEDQSLTITYESFICKLYDKHLKGFIQFN